MPAEQVLAHGSVIWWIAAFIRFVFVEHVDQKIKGPQSPVIKRYRRRLTIARPDRRTTT
jgi:hypothetical protein